MTSLTTLPPWPLLCVLILVALAVGSFLNVVITRLPVILMRGWRAEAREALELPPESLPRFNLLTPGSLCPHCEHPITWHDNLPLLGYLKRRGRCAHCHGRISLQYPLVELTTLALTLVVVWQQGLGMDSLAILAACLMLLVLGVIDLRTQLLPDILTQPLLWGGLLYHLVFAPSGLTEAIIGAVAGYLVLWSLYWLFRLLTRREGMGQGDFKLLAALGAWCGWPSLPLLLVIATLLGSIYGIGLQLLRPATRGQPIAFGPFLVIAGWLMLLCGPTLMAAYMSTLGL
ncbi:prepilin peptidase [Kushneria phosphatilytica]|uniref:prepilin peptidase n=1 Tax=Kushneria phosphatilytica TaxID=657387 RepID=UPI000A06F689|nr:A24 family peptidase [Kushneria phosphatilytica]